MEYKVKFVCIVIYKITNERAEFKKFLWRAKLLLKRLYSEFWQVQRHMSKSLLGSFVCFEVRSGRKSLKRSFSVRITFIGFLEFSFYIKKPNLKSQKFANRYWLMVINGYIVGIVLCDGLPTSNILDEHSEPSKGLLVFDKIKNFHFGKKEISFDFHSSKSSIHPSNIIIVSSITAKINDEQIFHKYALSTKQMSRYKIPRLNTTMKPKTIFYSQKRKFENLYLAKELQNISVLETIFIYKSQIPFIH
ncbi:hypothetical protein AGLY_013637 [Aphis glycines]|uniref:Uncharacterized protein n=1 Tax=Aphis glycines TaxID=307491 RepID=A0A6G0T8Z5_APHGL|nr:hypothetical protein AGLY_013637 [Aphis glycines]